MVPLERDTYLEHADARAREAFSANPPDEEALKEAVCAVVDLTRGGGWQIERVIVHVKRLAEAGLEEGQRRRDPDLARSVVAKAVTWSIQRYYGSAS